MSLGLVFGVLATAVAPIQPVTYSTSVPRPGVFVLHLHDRVPQGVSLQRDSSGLVLTFPGAVVGEMPSATGPIEEFKIEQDDGRVAIRLTLQADAAVAIERAGEGLIVEVEGVATPTSGEHPRMAELYPLLFPSGMEPAQRPVVASATVDAPRQGLWLGPLNVRPAITLRYVDSDSFFDEGPKPIPVRYLEIGPVIDGSVARDGGDGGLTFRYAPRFRTGSSEDAVNSTTHILGAGVDYSFSPGTGLRGGYHFVTGTLETREVDPGGEFFFGLQPFTRHGVDGSLDVAIGTVWGVGAGAGWNWVDIDEQSGFFSHERGSADANLWYDMSPTLRVRAGYRYDRVPPPPDRPIAESRANTAFVSLAGELSPTTRATLSVGYRNQTNPNIGGQGSSFNSVTYEGRIHRDISWSSSVTLTVFRTPLPSAFQGNAFYSTTGLGLGARLPLPWQVSANASIDFRRNSYEQDTLIPGDGGNILDVGDPRRDDLFGWSVGLGRPLTGWGFIRADYRRTKRDSNVPTFSNTTEAFLLQVGFGYFGQP